MERNAICTRLEHFICGSIYAHDSNEWRAGQYDIHSNNKDCIFDILQMQTPISFSSHSVTRKIPSHSHLHFELMYLLRGKITHHFGAQTITLSEGDLLIISPETAHSIDACSDDTIAVNITIKDSFFSRGLLRTIALCGPIHDIFSGSRSGYLHLRSHSNAEAAAAADMLFSEFLNPDILSAELVKIYFCSLMCILYRIYTDESCRIYKKTGEEHGNIAFVISYIENNFATASLNKAAQLFGYDRSYLSKLIHRSTGKTFTQLKHSFCLDQAKHLLLTTSLPVREISEQVGFSNVSYFYTIFSEECGMTPTLWREKYAL